MKASWNSWKDRSCISGLKTYTCIFVIELYLFLNFLQGQKIVYSLFDRSTEFDSENLWKLSVISQLWTYVILLLIAVLRWFWQHKIQLVNFKRWQDLSPNSCVCVCVCVNLTSSKRLWNSMKTCFFLTPTPDVPLIIYLFVNINLNLVS